MPQPRTPPDATAGPVALDEVRAAVDAAAGRSPGSLLLRHARLINVLTGELVETPTDVLVSGRLIAGIGDYADVGAEHVIDLDGAWLAPGLIDGHVHIESSLVGPAAYAEAVVPRGVTGVVCDPHEIGNVAGIPGIEWLLERSEALPLDVWVTAPSCVPSTRLETSGAELGLDAIAELLAHPRVVGVAEIMSFPDVIAGDPENLSKVLLAEAAGGTPEGHAPGVSGRALQAYLAAGIVSDHESTTLAEGTEKLRNGVFLMVREGSVTRNLGALLPLVQPRHGDRIGFVTDDRLPHDLLDEGGVDCLVRGAIAGGADAAYAVRCASWNVARHYRLPRRGAIAPGFLADLVAIDDLPAFHAAAVFKQGRRVAADGRLVAPASRPAVDDTAVRGTVVLPELDPSSLRLPDPGGEVRVIAPVPSQILTEELRLRPTVVDGHVVADPGRDLLKVICVERHGRSSASAGTGPGGSGRSEAGSGAAGVGVGLVQGFGLQRGALASTVGHDHHALAG